MDCPMVKSIQRLGFFAYNGQEIQYNEGGYKNLLHDTITDGKQIKLVNNVKRSDESYISYPILCKLFNRLCFNNFEIELKNNSFLTNRNTALSLGAESTKTLVYKIIPMTKRVKHRKTTHFALFVDRPPDTNAEYLNNCHLGARFEASIDASINISDVEYSKKWNMFSLCEMNVDSTTIYYTG